MPNKLIRLLPLTPVVIVVVVFVAKGDCRAPEHQPEKQEPQKGSRRPMCCPAGNHYPVWGTRPSDLWTVSYLLSLVEHWDGTEWDGDYLVELPSPVCRLEEQNFEDYEGARTIWGTGPDDVWVIDQDGGVWRRQPWGLFEEEPLSGIVEALGGSGPDDVWAVGRDGVTAHWEGTRWNVPPRLGAERLRSVWSSSPSNAWTLSDSGAAFHWDGSSWTPVRLPSTPPHSKLRGFGPDDLWIFGPDGFVMNGDGMRWKHLPAPPPASGGAPDVSEVVRRGNVVWALTAAGLARWDGTTWRAVAVPDFRSAREKAEDRCPELSCPPRFLARVGSELVMRLGYVSAEELVVGDGTTWRPLQPRNER